MVSISISKRLHGPLPQADFVDTFALPPCRLLHVSSTSLPYLPFDQRVFVRPLLPPRILCKVPDSLISSKSTTVYTSMLYCVSQYLCRLVILMTRLGYDILLALDWRKLAYVGPARRIGAETNDARA
jgi:hypothetical protein